MCLVFILCPRENKKLQSLHSTLQNYGHDTRKYAILITAYLVFEFKNAPLGVAREAITRVNYDPSRKNLIRLKQVTYSFRNPRLQEKSQSLYIRIR